jgi:hypothetical protein
MRAMVLAGVATKDAFEMSCIDDEKMIEALGPWSG